MAKKNPTRAKLHAKLAEYGLTKFARGAWWENEEQSICVLLTEKHTDVLLFAGQSFRLMYETPEAFLGDVDRLLGPGDEGTDVD